MATRTAFPAIQDLTLRRVRRVVRLAVRAGFDANVVSDFLAGVDWGSSGAADLKVRATLGQMEAWATAFAEGELTLAQYVARLLSLLPRAERGRRLTMGAGEVAVTLGPGLAAVRPADERFRSESGTRFVPALA
ncbi:MAG: hypothetical protein IT304_01920 [Dehalococcoidia bacterium]|nr:hypothetical protein [Dehalococcoidia bacterium]